MSKRHGSNSKYWRNKADKENTRLHRGKPCEICGTTHQTCGHHVVERSISAYYRHDQRNMVDLCTTHHKFSNEIAPHSKNPLAVEAWLKWLRKNRQDANKILSTYKLKTGAKIDYEQKFNDLKGK